MFDLLIVLHCVASLRYRCASRSVISRFPKVVQVLLDHCADPTIRDKWNQIPRDYLQKETLTTRILSNLKSLEINQMLKEAETTWELEKCKASLKYAEI